MGYQEPPEPMSDQELISHTHRLRDLTHGERSSLQCAIEDLVRRGSLKAKTREKLMSINLRHIFDEARKGQ